MKYILFCEDDYYYSQAGYMGLSDKFPDYTVISSYSGEQSIKRIASHLNDLELVLTDGQLAGKMTGWDLAKELRNKGYEGPIVYTGLTALPDDIDENLFTGHSPKKLETPKELRETYASIAEYYLKK